MTSPGPKRIALVAHDDRKGDLIEWAEHNRDVLARQVLYATGTTGQMLGDRLDLPVTCFQSGPLGGDQQIGALIASGDLDVLVFFWDPMSPQPHDSDVKALVRIAVVWNIPLACNRTSADYLITSPLLGGAEAGNIVLLASGIQRERSIRTLLISAWPMSWDFAALCLMAGAGVAHLMGAEAAAALDYRSRRWNSEQGARDILWPLARRGLPGAGTRPCRGPV